MKVLFSVDIYILKKSLNSWY